jgi:hypothetical protein
LEDETGALLEQKKIEERFGKKTLTVCARRGIIEGGSAILSYKSPGEANRSSRRGRSPTDDDDSPEPSDQADAASRRSPFPPPRERPKDIAALPAFFRSRSRGSPGEVRERAEEMEFAEEEVGV